MTRLIICLLIILSGFSTALACSCIRVFDTLEKIYPDQIVLSGKILSKELVILYTDEFDTNHTLIIWEARYSMEVIHVYNGKRIADTIEIRTAAGGGGDCGFPFVLGETYIVFASNRPRKFLKTNSYIETDICTFTQLFTEEFDKKIKLLEKN